MIESLYLLFSTSGLLPHGDSFLWRPDLVWLHAISDGVIALFYGFVAIVLLRFVRRQTDFAHGWLIYAFGAFLLLHSGVHALDIWTLWHPDYGLSGLAKVLAALASLAAALFLSQTLGAPDAKWTLSLQRDPDGTPDRYKRIESELHKLSLVVEHSPSMVLITDGNGQIEYCNSAFCKCTGYTRTDAIWQRAAIWNSETTDSAVYRELWNTLHRGESWEGELLERKKNGETFWCLEHVTPMRDEQGAIAHYIVISQDITELKNSEETIRRLAFFDPLTHLPNRTLFRERLEQTLQDAKRDKTSFAVIHLDLDRFKNINDSLGHSFGDQVLFSVSQRLRRCLREEDIVARLSGDEFAIILPNLQHPKLAEAAATAITQAMNRPFEVAGHDLFVTASLGISLYPTDHAEIDQLIKMADTAMYNAKALGRNQYQYYKKMSRDRTDKQLALETGLRYALERNELEVFYQPKFELASGRCHAAEALLRWRHPEQGMVSPGQFIPIAEETGLIITIGEWVLHQACRQIVKWRSMGLDMSVAVNLSAQQFRQKNLLERIDAIIQETGVDRNRLELEITESAVMGDPQQTAAIMHGMKARGLALSIDDFGTGYSSLSYLQMFPIDILKIDQSFVRGIGTPAGDTRIVKAIIALAHSLELTVVAEGAETLEQIDFLKRHRCDMVQGYFYSPPVPSDALLERLRPSPSDPDSAMRR
jgi:diguanylate cyclase (GGDEF)-like protein/PAS domain S-box-containing protein